MRNYILEILRLINESDYAVDNQLLITVFKDLSKDSLYNTIKSMKDEDLISFVNTDSINLSEGFYLIETQGEEYLNTHIKTRV